MVFVSLFSGISTCSGDLELDSSVFISIYFVQDIDGEIVGLIGKSGFRS